jgi:hypothetical protein
MIPPAFLRNSGKEAIINNSEAIAIAASGTAKRLFAALAELDQI